MPLNVRRFCTSIFFSLIGFAAIVSAQVQPTAPPQNAQTAPANAAPATRQPTAAEVMRDRISKAKAYIAVRNYNAAIYELENIRRETSDTSVNAVANVLLMNSYLEQGDYKRAQDFLTEFYRSYKSNSANGNLYYTAVAAQIVKGARDRVERYRNLGLSVSDRNLPLEAVNDVERMRETLELVITQAKETGKDPAKSSDAVVLLEEATNSRSIIARDDYDARRWRDEAADSREQMASSRSVVINAVDVMTAPTETPIKQQTVAANIPPSNPEPKLVQKTVDSRPIFQPAADAKPKPSDAQIAVSDKGGNPSGSEGALNAANAQATGPLFVGRVSASTPGETAKAKPIAEPAEETGPLDVGSLIAYATQRSAPAYPVAAKNMRAAGVVRVEVTIDEKGDVAEVQKATGPGLLQSAARDAVKKWKFKPFQRDGQPVKATGFVNFNFSL